MTGPLRRWPSPGAPASVKGAPEEVEPLQDEQGDHQPVHGDVVAPEVRQPMQDFRVRAGKTCPETELHGRKGERKMNFVPTMPMPPAYARYLGLRAAAGGLLL